MVRLQSPLAATFVDASPEELEARLAAAKAALGTRLVILGHHYQREEVMRWADARGDSFGLSRLGGRDRAGGYNGAGGGRRLGGAAGRPTRGDPPGGLPHPHPRRPRAGRGRNRPRAGGGE